VEIDAYQYWMDQLANKSPNTVRNYTVLFHKFLKWSRMTPNELFQAALDSKRNNGDDPREGNIIESKVKQFLHLLGEEGKSERTQQATLVSIKSFFAENKVPLDLKAEISVGDSEGSRIPEKEEVVKMVNAAKSQGYRAAILMLKDCGLRISDLVRLRWEDMEDWGDGFYGWKIKAKKNKVRALPFIGPEASEILFQWKPKQGKGRIFPILAQTLSNAVTDIINSTDLKEGLSGHGLRKFFNTELTDARVPKEYRYMIMGKKVSTYDEKRTRRLFKVYKDAYPHLKVYGSEQANERITTLEEENQALRQRLEKAEDTLDRMHKIDLRDKDLLQNLRSLLPMLHDRSKRDCEFLRGEYQKTEELLAKFEPYVKQLQSKPNKNIEDNRLLETAEHILASLGPELDERKRVLSKVEEEYEKIKKAMTA